MNVLHVSPEITTLSEGLIALRTLEWPDTGVFSEVISQVAALLEDTATALVLTLEE